MSSINGTPIYCIIGRSGSGKTTLCDELQKNFGWKTVESITTRLPRSLEEKGHLFVTQEQFDAKRSKLVAYTKFDNYEYGVTAKMLDEADLYVIDPAGFLYLKEHYDKRPLRIIYLSLSEEKAIERMKARGDTEEQIAERVQNDRQSFSKEMLDKLGPMLVLDVSTCGQRELAACVASYLLWGESSFED